MPHEYTHTKGIILKRTHYKDADRILTIYTNKLGKITARARGIRKIKSKKKSHLELLNHSDLYLVKGRYWYIVTQAQLLDSFNHIKSELNTTQHAYYISEIFTKLIPEEVKDEKLYRFLIRTFESLHKDDPFKITNAFTIKLLKMLGYYSHSLLNKVNEEMRNYCYELERSTYNQICKKDYSTKTGYNVYIFLNSYVQEVLERPVKTILTKA